MVDSTRAPARFAELDGLRAFAAFLVFLFHGFRRARLVFGDWFVWTWQLDVGVPVFFALSGFLIYRPFVAAALDGRPSPLSGYFRRRFTRIYPAYWAALVVLLLVGTVEVRDVAGFFKQATLTFSYFKDPGGGSLLQAGTLEQAWTLVVEVSFYVFVPVWAWLVLRVARLMANRVLLVTVLGVVGLVVAGYLFIWTQRDQLVWTGMVVLPRSLAALGGGMLLATLSAARRTRPGLDAVLDRIGRPWVWWAAALALFWSLGTIVPFDYQFSIYTTDARCVERMIQATIGIVLVASFVLAPDRRSLLRDVFASRAMVFFGTVSYGFYLWHVGVLDWFSSELPKGSQGGSALWMLLALAISLAIAAVSWYALERPALRWASRRRAAVSPPTRTIRPSR